MRKVFETFLKECEMYDEFMSRAHNYLGEEELENMFANVCPEFWICSAFVWGEGEEGEEYLANVKKWKDLEDKWLVCVNSR